MTIGNITREEYTRLFEPSGGEHVVILDKEDISAGGAFENCGLIRPYLTSGFEIPPTPIISEPEMAAGISVYGDDWTKVIAKTYTRGGKIIYKQRSDGRYEAKITVPKGTAA